MYTNLHTCTITACSAIFFPGQEIVGCLITEFSTFYRISPERIEKVFQLAKQELGDSMNAYYATQTLLVNMFRANSEPIWKISK